MVIVTLRMKVFPGKFKEVCQTVRALRGRFENEKGFLGLHIYRDIENQNGFCLMKEWETREDLEHYLHSDNFGVLLGAIHFLAESPDLKISTVSSMKEMGTDWAMKASAQ